MRYEFRFEDFDDHWVEFHGVVSYDIEMTKDEWPKPFITNINIEMCKVQFYKILPDEEDRIGWRDALPEEIKFISSHKEFIRELDRHWSEDEP
jgi:hypothetical protein